MVYEQLDYWSTCLFVAFAFVFVCLLHWACGAKGAIEDHWSTCLFVAFAFVVCFICPVELKGQ